MNMSTAISHSRDRTEANTAHWSILGESEPEPPYSYRTRTAIGYPYPRVYVYMILSCLCVIWNTAFVAAYTGGSWYGCSVPKTTHDVLVKPSKARDTVVKRQANTIFLGVDQADSTVPTFIMKSEKRGRHRLRKSMLWNKKGVAFTASASPTTMAMTTTTSNNNTDPELRSRLTTMLETNENGPLSLLGEDALVIAIIADTGCTMASSFDPLDFEGPIIPIYPVTRMQGIERAATVEIRGRGTIQWTVIDDSGTSRVIRTPGYYVPDMHVRLLSPQAYMREPGSSCKEFRLSAHAATVSWSSDSSRNTSDSDLRVHTLTIPYDDATSLPYMRAYRNLTDSAEAVAVAAGASFFSVTDAYLHSVKMYHADKARHADKVAYTTYNTPCAAATTLDEHEDWRASWMHAWRSR
jgi:hypothetical protein